MGLDDDEQGFNFKTIAEIDAYIRDGGEESVKKLRDDIEKQARAKGRLSEMRQATAIAIAYCKVRNNIKDCFKHQIEALPMHCPILYANDNGHDPTEDDAHDADSFVQKLRNERQ